MSSLNDFCREIAESTPKSPLGSTPSSYDLSNDPPTPATDAEAEAEAEKCSNAFLSIYAKLQRQMQETNSAIEKAKAAEKDADKWRKIAEMAHHVYEPTKKELDRARGYRKEAEEKIERLEAELYKIKKQRDEATAELYKIRKAGGMRSWEL
ncbi:uncharacterized protein KY384_006792 [Bacidia gigantensis]|uniref:uncharacterized protein n=1 Tax=Bacidia gigantensis TaxID=2732470 RepID=UPI001D039903|nr:uncharacterized protein KY384_006792 [Bacidia gigantensis]KAG8527876.1 hypothetical protein KY384_006792 [Bacidia gigantensis]